MGRLDRPCRQRRPFSLGNNRNKYGRNRTTKITGNENPSHPQGIGMYVGDYYPHKGGMYNLGRRVKDIMSLPKEVIRYIKWVTTT